MSYYIQTPRFLLKDTTALDQALIINVRLKSELRTVPNARKSQITLPPFISQTLSSGCTQKNCEFELPISS